MSEIGHNSGYKEAVRNQMDEIISVRQERRDEFIAKIDAKQVTNRELAGDAADLIKLGKAFADIVEGQRKAITDPLRQAAEAGKGMVDEFLIPLDEAIGRLKARLDAWDAEDQERMRAQQAEQEEQMQAMRARAEKPDVVAPPLQPAKRRQIRGDYGAKVSEAEVITWTVEDVSQVPANILNSETVKAAIVQVAKSMEKHFTVIPGLRREVSSVNRIK